MSAEQTSEGEELGSEKIKQELLSYLGEERLGSVRHRAFFDYTNHDKLMGDWRDKVDSLPKIKNPSRKLVEESRVRISEFKLALLETEIERNKTTLPGYDQATEHIESMLERLQSTMKDERGKLNIPEGVSEDERDQQIERQSAEDLEKFEKAVEGIRTEIINREN